MKVFKEEIVSGVRKDELEEKGTFVRKILLRISVYICVYANGKNIFIK